MQDEDFIGKTFGYLTVVKLKSRDKRGSTWVCKCVCGNEVTLQRSHIIGTKTRNPNKSCGCKQKIQEGFTVSHNKLYKTWKFIQAVCNNAEHPNYHHYGDKGIEMCDEWKNNFNAFLNWALNNGYEEDSNLIINRTNPKGNFDPDNCRWADKYVQASNKGLRKNNKTGYQCICEGKSGYRVDTMRMGQRIHIGCYKQLEEAVNERNKYFLQRGWKLPVDK